MKTLYAPILLALAASALLMPPAKAEHVKIGIVRVANSAGDFIAIERGYFKAEGIDPELVYFEGGGVPIPAGVVSGALDFGETATSASLYNLAGNGELKIIGGETREARTFHNFALAASNKAWAAGLRAFKDLPGHSLALPSRGGTPEYRLALIAQKFGFDPTSVQLRVVQSVPNVIAAVKAGQVDATINASTQLVPLFASGDAKLIGWISDQVRFQSAVTFTSSKTANERQDLVRRFLRAIHHGFLDFHNAFTGPGEVRQDRPDAEAVLAIISKYTEQTVASTRLSIAYVPPDGGGLAVADIARQIAWFKEQGQVKGPVDVNQIVDMRYVNDVPVR